ncbi:MAG: hypothetical protein FGM57_01490 [Candidatus Taylorbacteria bacterium]|nr:hypothetical protein [Candidatus Taylorbacteria bacterium]
MMKDSPTYRALSNALFSMISFGWPIIIAIFVTPYVVNSLGVKEYGVYLFISTLISLAGLLDVGIASALGKFIAEENGRRNENEIKKIFSIGNSIFLLIGILGSLGILSTIFIGKVFFAEKMIEYFKYIPAFIAAAGMFFLTSTMSLFSMLPNALQRIDAGVKVGLSFFTTQQLVIVLIIALGYGVNGIFFGLLGIYVIFHFWYAHMAKSILPDSLKKALRVYSWDKEAVLKYYSFGIKVFVNNIANSSLTFLDKAIMPIFVGPANLSYYGIAGSISNKTPAVSNTFANVIFPMTASFEGVGDRERTKMLYIRSMRLITILSVSITVTILSFPYKMLAYWINEEVAIFATATLIPLTWTNLILSLTGPLTNFLVGMGRLRALTTASVTAAILNAIFLFLLLPHYGIYGAALAYLFALTPYLFLFYWTEHNLLALNSRIKFYIIFVCKLFFTGYITYMLNQYVISPYIYNLTTVLVGSAISVLSYIFIYYICGLFEKDDVRDLKLFARSVYTSIQKRF